MSFRDDLDSDLANVFFNKDEFADVVAVYRPADGEPYEIHGIFDKSSENPNPQGNDYATVQSFYIRLKVNKADIIGGTFKQDTLTIGETDYLLIDDDDDGHGVLTLKLQEQQ